MKKYTHQEEETERPERLSKKDFYWAAMVRLEEETGLTRFQIFGIRNKSRIGVNIKKLAERYDRPVWLIQEVLDAQLMAGA
jgi:hypothetical protein